MLFLQASASDAASPVDTVTRMGLLQFKSLLQAAKVTSSSVPAEKFDELYMSLQASQGAMARCVEEGQACGKSRCEPGALHPGCLLCTHT